MIRVVENLADLVADRVVDALDVELRGERRLHAVDDRELGVALLGLLQQPLRFVEQTRVLERDAHARGDGRQQAHLGFAEGVFALVILETGWYRARDRRRRSANRNHEMLCSVPGVVRNQSAAYSAAVSKPRGSSRCIIVASAVGDAGPDGALAALDTRRGNDAGFLRRIVPADADVARGEDLAQLVADEIDDRLEVELLGHPLLDAVDDRELGVALLGLLQQRCVSRTGARSPARRPCSPRR